MLNLKIHPQETVPVETNLGRFYVQAVALGSEEAHIVLVSGEEMEGINQVDEANASYELVQVHPYY